MSTGPSHGRADNEEGSTPTQRILPPEPVGYQADSQSTCGDVEWLSADTTRDKGTHKSCSCCVLRCVSGQMPSRAWRCFVCVLRPQEERRRRQKREYARRKRQRQTGEQKAAESALKRRKRGEKACSCQAARAAIGAAIAAGEVHIAIRSLVAATAAAGAARTATDWARTWARRARDARIRCEQEARREEERRKRAAIVNGELFLCNACPRAFGTKRGRAVHAMRVHGRRHSCIRSFRRQLPRRIWWTS